MFKVDTCLYKAHARQAAAQAKSGLAMWVPALSLAFAARRSVAASTDARVEFAEIICFQAEVLIQNTP